SVGRYTTPATQDNLDVEQSDGEDECDESEYRSLVGKLLYAANTVRSRSRTGSIICYGGSPIGWKSKLQTMVSLSTVNAELLALCYTVAESVWVVNLLDAILKTKVALEKSFF
ncbi:hypothetical protein HF325_003016, partial [Metschnikowia pulcherrima]